MHPSASLGTRSIPSALRDTLEITELVVQDLAVRVAEGSASLEALEDARDALRQIVEFTRAYLRHEVEREIFAFPRARRSAAPATH